MVMQVEQQVDQNSQSSSGDQKEENESSSVEIEENVMKFLDSMDNYLILMNSLSSTLRQGWLELASARHSMGTSRVSSAFFDLKDHAAATTLQVNVDSPVEEPVFKLHKWATSESDGSKSVPGLPVSEDDKLLPSQNGSPIHQNPSSGNSDVQEKKGENDGSPIVNQVQKQRLKTLSMFGALFPPKLRAAQLSFETALGTLTEIANARASILAAHEQVHKEMESTSK